MHPVYFLYAVHANWLVVIESLIFTEKLGRKDEDLWWVIWIIKFNAHVRAFYFYMCNFYVSISFLIVNFVNYDYIRFAYWDRLDIIDGRL